MRWGFRKKFGKMFWASPLISAKYEDMYGLHCLSNSLWCDSSWSTQNRDQHLH